MDEERRFLIRVWTLVLIGVLIGVMCFFATITIITVHTDYRIAEVIESGVSPIEARYAFKYADIHDDVAAWMWKQQVTGRE